MKEKTVMDLSHELFQLMKRFPHLELKRSSRYGLTRSENELLAILVISANENKKAFTVTEISNRLQITPAGVTHLINPLEKAGYIERLRNPDDHRIVQIGLTGKGIKVAETLIADVREQLIGLFNHLGEEDSMTFVRLMSRTVEFFSAQS